ncbi:uncharacterized protein LOC121247356 [Juglans microcarpa x Juglans regia]|uniref:uncharacterized protein LOC121247356 n=1 Tax=Juglans microcarpa x Juglans regia TaxID=2249226 RepID=UPI001B7EA0F4|nr:uncharacterized protein LOC121247356 [Juglans microcarpa x Juglans regia]
MSSRRRRCPVAYLLTIKQGEEESLKTYLARFNRERMTTDDQDKKITLAALLGRVWWRSQFMAELARWTLLTLQGFMDQADNFINVEDTLWALTESRKNELERAERKARAQTNAKVQEKP